MWKNDFFGFHYFAKQCNFVQGRCKSFAINNYIVTKKNENNEIVQLIKSFKVSTDLILHDYEVFQRYIFEKKINPLYNKEPDAHTSDVMKTYIKLANDRDFFNELKEIFPSKLTAKSDHKQWKSKLTYERQSPRKDKPKLLRK